VDEEGIHSARPCSLERIEKRDAYALNQSFRSALRARPGHKNSTGALRVWAVDLPVANRAAVYELIFRFPLRREEHKYGWDH